MKIKYILIILCLLLFLISMSQVFSIPPFAEDIYTVYRSGYFSELEKGFDIIKESFIQIKMMSKPVYAWIFLEDLKKKYNIDVKVYNSRGVQVAAPGKKGKSRDGHVINILNSVNTNIYSEPGFRKYYSAVPVLLEKRCRFCHNTGNRNKIIGVMTFERGYNSFIYYSSERILIFSVLSIIIAFLIYILIRWDPGRVSRELFDK